jgi:CoA:oxalate CoA-transferase
MVDIAMLDCQVAILENAIARHSATGDVPGPLGARHPSITPFGAFPAADRPIVIAAGNDALFRKLCATLGRPEWVDDPRFLDNDARTRHADELDEEIGAVLGSERADVWLERLEQGGVPCGPINNIADVVADPAVRARNMIVGVDLPDGTRLEIAGNPIKLSAHDDPPDRPVAPDTLG